MWIINPYGTLPSESWATYRSTMVAEALSAHGYQVSQFISNFEHRSKQFRTSGSERVTIGGRYAIRIIPGQGYAAHISLQRVRHERSFARNLLAAVKGEPPPDLVILAEPALFYYDILLGPLIVRHRSLLVLDVIDIWPELFELVIPRGLRPLSPVLLAPLYRWRKRLYAHADAVVGVARDYTDIGSRLAARPGVLAATVYWSSSAPPAASAPPGEALEGLLAGKGERDLWIVYAGTLGENYDIHSIVDVARRLPADVRDHRRVRFIVAGDGPLRSLCEASASQDFVFVGRLAAAHLELLYRRCDVALCTYKGGSTVAMPIKAFDYLRHGLPIVNSLARDLGEFVQRDRIGLNYRPESSDSLYHAIVRLVRDEELRAECARNSRRLAGQFSPDRQYAIFVELIDRLCQRLPSTQ